MSGAMIKLAESINRSIVDESNIFFGKLWFESIISEKIFLKILGIMLHNTISAARVSRSIVMDISFTSLYYLIR